MSSIHERGVQDKNVMPLYPPPTTSRRRIGLIMALAACLT